MLVRKLELETVCGVTSSLPQHEIPEVAFWGRSNVGKSSLLNTIWGRKSMARVSSEPGKTRTINYYNVNDALYMVDLPGYGYAKTSRKTTASWMHMIRHYLEKSAALRMTCLLIDSRHAPTDSDIAQFDLLFSLGFNPLIVATKVDKLKKNEKAKNIAAISRTLDAEVMRLLGDEYTSDITIPVIPFSSSTGEGKDELWDYIEGGVYGSGL